jgi:radical SAM superfamily enzyme YgiQ (UPF0313 family)
VFPDPRARAGPRRVLLVDLNNFARYPSVAVGTLVAILRRAGVEVEVFSPLSIGVPGVAREPRAAPWGRIDHFARHVSAHATMRPVRGLRAALAALRHPIGPLRSVRVQSELARRLGRSPDVVLVSTYLLYRSAVAALAARCSAAGIPVVVGGPYFAQPEVVDAWRTLPGVTAVFGGEAEARIVALVETAAAGRDPTGEPGVSTVRSRGRPMPPLGSLDAWPFPDYSDFAWDRVPNRIVPVLTGRGCGWGACTFCSDVTSSSGRSFRSRSAPHVLAELAHQATACATSLFVFTDLKLNSDLTVWRALLDGARRAVPGCQWIGSVHLDGRQDNGLDRESLKAAAAAGMARLTTGVESGSQRVLDRMDKGTDVARSEQVLRHAAEAGISVRVTMIVGSPGEEPEDVERSAAFLERNAGAIDRVVLNRFAILAGTRIHRRLRRGVPGADRFADLRLDAAEAIVHHHDRSASSRAARRALWRLLGAVHAVNRRPLGLPARAFEGVM